MDLVEPGIDGRIASGAWTAPVGSPPLIMTKLRPPVRVAGYRERARILARLDQALDDSVHLTLLSAPPGYGKSVATAGWIASRGVPHCWLSLDAADNDPVRFLRYLGAALEPLRRGIASRTDALARIDPGLASAAAVLVDAIAAVDAPLVLVLDDYHVISASPVHDLMRDLIALGPPFLHVVVLTREDPPFPVARLRAHRRLVEIRADDLRFSEDEAVDYLRETFHVALDQAHLDALLEATEGWIAGLQLAALSSPDHDRLGPFVDRFRGNHRFVLDYLASEILERLDPDLASFLVDCSVAPRFTASLCRALSGRSDSAGLLERTGRMNLFLIPLDDEGAWYRFHHLFADYLRTRLDPDAEREQRERAAEWLEGAGLVDEAVEQALAAGSVDRAARLLERCGRDMYDSGELSLLLRRLEALPAQRLARSGELSQLAALSAFMVGRVADAERICDEAERARSARLAADDPCPMSTDVPAGLGVVRALIAAFENRSDAVEIASAAAVRVAGDPFFAMFSDMGLASAHLSAGNLKVALEHARLAQGAAATSGSVVSVTAITALGNALLFLGRRDEAEAACRAELATHAAQARYMGGGTPYALFWLGSMRYEAGDVAGALADLERAWAAMGTFGFGRSVLTAMSQYIVLARLASGRPGAALEAIRTMQRDTRAAGLAGVEHLLGGIEARVLLAQGDVATAGRWADRFVRDMGLTHEGASVRWSDLPGVLSAARVRISLGHVREATRLLGIARSVAERSGDVADLVSVGVLEATVRCSVDPAAAEVALGEAVRLAAPGRYVRRFVDDGATVKRLLPRVRRLAAPFVDEVIAAFARGRDSPADRGTKYVISGDDGVPGEALTDRELEVLRLIAAGRSDAAIARELVVSLATAKWHAAHIRAKLSVESRTQAVLRAQSLGLV